MPPDCDSPVIKYLTGDVTPALAECELIFADSLDALCFAWDRGLSRSVPVHTSAPALIRDPDIRCEPSNGPLSPEDMERLGAANDTFCADLHKALQSANDLASFIPVALFTATSFQNVLQKAATLRPDVFSLPVAVLTLETGSAKLDRVYNAPWPDLLADHPRLSVVSVPNQAFRLEEALSTEQEHPTLVTRLANLRQRFGFAPFREIFYPLATRFWERSDLYIPRGSFLSLTANPTIRETMCHLALWGFAVRRLTPPAVPSDTSLAPEITVGLEECLSPVVRRHFSDWVPEHCMPTLLTMYMERLIASASTFLAALPRWRSSLDRLARIRPRAVLTNLPKSPVDYALHAICRERGLPIVAYQHGVSREISNNLDNVRAISEVTVSDFFLTYNHRCVEMADANPFRVGRAMPVGLPMDYWRAASHRRPDPDSPPIFYVATSLYAGNINVNRGAMTDGVIAKFECEIVDEVLARLPHRVLYKPYPTDLPRYPDPDPILERVKAVPNITIYEDGDDLRFLLPDARVIITSRATSTLSWCLMSGKPVVFIDNPGSLPLRPEAREAFEKALFLFDAGAPDFHDRLVAFLSQPIAEIERLYAERLSAREAARDRFIQTGGPGAGKRAARLLRDMTRDNTARSNNCEQRADGAKRS